MDEFFTPEMGLAAAKVALSDLECRVALVLPTTRQLNEDGRQPQDAWSVIGRPDRGGTKGATEVFSRLSSGQTPTPIIVHTDQLYRPADATILAVLENRKVYLSPVECILNDKYGYRLLVWTASGLRALAAKSPWTDIGSLTIEHLRDCSLLGKRWLERDQQVQRTVEHRLKSGKRQLRYLHSSVANAYMTDPANPTINALVKRIDDLSREFEKAQRG
jgi:hypothetical protein